MTLSIANGMVLVNGELEEMNILIEDGKIIKLTEEKISGDRIDASGKIIIPGLIDCHVHLRDPGFTHKEDFSTGTKAAAAGGVTTVLDMPSNTPPITTVQLLQEKREIVKNKAVVNYGLYMAAADNAEEIKKAENIPGIKLYMGATTGMKVTSKDDMKNHFGSGIKTVIHAEDEEMMKGNEERYKKATDPLIHAKIRSREVEIEAVRRAISYADSKSNMHFTHITTEGSLGIIAEARKKYKVSCDVTPHHLFLTFAELKKQGNFAKMNPALRDKEDVGALWRGIAEGIVDVIVTDHAPHTKDEKEADYWEAPSGVPGLETMLPLLLNAVNKNRIKLEKVVELTSTNPARLFGIKNKGKIEVGMDADLTIIDMNKEKEVKNEDLFTKCGWSPFAGWKLKGWPVTTIVNGEIVYNEGEITKSNGSEVIYDE